MSRAAEIDPAATVGPLATLGPGCRVMAGARLLGEVFVGADATIGPNACLVAEPGLPIVVEDGVLVGAGAAALAGVRIGRRAVVGAGAVVTRDVPARTVVVGNPARILRQVDAGTAAAAPAALAPAAGRLDLGVGGAALIRLKSVADLRGNLAIADFGADVPFACRRFFAVFAVPSRELRGEHAHRQCHQLLVALAGQVTCLADDGKKRVETVLDAPDLALHLPPMVWGAQYKYSRDAVLGVFASDPYDPADYIRDYDEFLRLAKG